MTEDLLARALPFIVLWMMCTVGGFVWGVWYAGRRQQRRKTDKEFRDKFIDQEMSAAYKTEKAWPVFARTKPPREEKADDC